EPPGGDAAGPAPRHRQRNGVLPEGPGAGARLAQAQARGQPAGDGHASAFPAGAGRREGARGRPLRRRTRAPAQALAGIRRAAALGACLRKNGRGAAGAPSFYCSLARSSSLTCCGLALPLLAFITWPTRALNALSLPALNWVTLSGLAAITSSMIFSSAPVSFICRRPLASMMASTSWPSPDHSASNTWRAALFETVPSAMRASSAASVSAFTGASAISRSSLLRRRETSPMIQLLASLAWPEALAAASK